ncbi:hypothetical protein QQP08_008495 [Theobroma cacao]|nr:hypothetical protein QQP08_008495 [Theobroma cacao]
MSGFPLVRFRFMSLIDKNIYKLGKVKIEQAYGHKAHNTPVQTKLGSLRIVQETEGEASLSLIAKDQEDGENTDGIPAPASSISSATPTASHHLPSASKYC